MTWALCHTWGESVLKEVPDRARKRHFPTVSGPESSWTRKKQFVFGECMHTGPEGLVRCLSQSRSTLIFPHFVMASHRTWSLPNSARLAEGVPGSPCLQLPIAGNTGGHCCTQVLMLHGKRSTQGHLPSPQQCILPALDNAGLLFFFYFPKHFIIFKD